MANADVDEQVILPDTNSGEVAELWLMLMPMSRLYLQTQIQLRSQSCG